MSRILIMEDNRQLAQEWREVFELNGHSILMTHCGEDAIKVLEDEAIDLVISDLFVARGKGGLSVIGALLRMGDDAPPVIAVTGAASSFYEDSDENRFLRQARLLGASRSIKKPFLPAELVMIADELLPQT